MDRDCVVGLFGAPMIAWQTAGLPKPGIELTAHLPESALA
jgi:hypothetical protein